MEFGIFYFDLTILSNFFYQPTVIIILHLFAMVFWLIFFGLLLYAALFFYVDYVQGKNTSTWKYTLLAIDIPQLNVQTPKAVEQMFSHLAGAFDKPDVRAKFREGHKQRIFSFEIVSIEGYIQFLIWTEESLKDLVEASVYAQYPEAEITEVEDYTMAAPRGFPNDQYDIWGGEFGLAENYAFPIRCYHEFEHSISKDTVLKDPMGTFLESFSRIGHGEQMWFQILVQPVGNDWKEEAIEKIKHLIGDKSHDKKPGLFSNIKDATGGIVVEFGKQLIQEGFGGEGEKHEQGGGEPNNLKYLTPGQQKLVEAMEDKISKIGFKTKMRAIYLARKEVFNPTRGVNALVGAVTQFNSPTANSIIPKETTGVRGKKKSAHRKHELVEAYKKRKMSVGGNPFVFNIEELATIWHFPMSHVKTPLLQKAEAKIAEPPPGLPVEHLPFVDDFETAKNTEEKEKKSRQSFRTDSGEEILFDEF